MKIAIASGKGGTGKTFISTNLFWSAQKAGIPVTLIDCDAEEPNVREFIQATAYDQKVVNQKIPVIDTEKCIFCGMCQAYCNYNALICLPQQHYIQLIDSLCHDCGACSYICPAGAISEKDKPIGTIRFFDYSPISQIIEGCTEIGVHSPVPVIKQSIQQAPDNQLILMDAPPGISCPFIATIEKADYVILVTEPTPFGLNDLQLSVETLHSLSKPFGVIINRAGLGDRKIYDWLTDNGVDLLAEIPFDRHIAKLYSQNVILSGENAEYRIMFTNLLKAIINKNTTWNKL
jgi:MinD superfamily P-loop ATPase